MSKILIAILIATVTTMSGCGESKEVKPTESNKADVIESNEVTDEEAKVILDGYVDLTMSAVSFYASEENKEFGREQLKETASSALEVLPGLYSNKEYGTVASNLTSDYQAIVNSETDAELDEALVAFNKTRKFWTPSKLSPSFK